MGDKPKREVLAFNRQLEGALQRMSAFLAYMDVEGANPEVACLVYKETSALERAGASVPDSSRIAGAFLRGESAEQTPIIKVGDARPPFNIAVLSSEQLEKFLEPMGRKALQPINEAEEVYDLEQVKEKMAEKIEARYQTQKALTRGR